MGLFDTYFFKLDEPDDSKEAKKFQEDLAEAIYFVDLALKKNDKDMFMKYSSLYKQLMYEA